MPDLDQKALRAAFGTFMTGVTIVTAKASDGTLVGFTANSFTSVSMDPPLILVCPGNHLSSFDVFKNCTHFAANILSENQQDSSDIFAGSKGDRFAQVDWQADKNGVPILTEAIASFSCSTHKSITAGDHLVLIGKVEAFSKSDGLGLGYWKGGYFTLSKEREAQISSRSDEAIIVGAIMENQNGILVTSDNDKLALPSVELPHDAQARAGIRDHLNSIGLTVEIGRVYSVYHDRISKKRFIYFRATSQDINNVSLGNILPLDAAPAANWRDKAEAVMIRRYLTERSNNQFGLYIGDSNAGEVHHETQG